MKRACLAIATAAACLVLTLLTLSRAPGIVSAEAASLPPVYRLESSSFQSSSDLPITVTLANGYRITFLGVTYHADGTSTWRYHVEELATAQDLSYWVLELPECTSVVDAAPEPWEVVYPDPNAHLDGIKWQTGAGFHQGEFTVTITGHWAVDITAVAAKGPDLAYGLIAGPICEPPLELEKTVDPTIAQPGDVLTYTITVRNVGLVWFYGAVLTDTIPVSTTYVGGSAQATSGFIQYDPLESLIRWQGDLAPAQAVTITFMVWVHDAVPAGTLITNTAFLGRERVTATTLIEAATQPAWVLLVYLSADNNLDNPAFRVIRDWEAFNALERAVLLNPRLRVYVLWDRSPDHADDMPDDRTRRYRVRPDLDPFALAAYTEGVDTWNLGEKNMGDPQTLYDFIAWARGSYTSLYEALSIIGHGGGWSPTLDPALGYTAYLPTGLVWDDSSGDYLSTRELGEALYWATDEQVDPLDVLFLDASMMAMLENAYEVRDSAGYLVASEGTVWARFAYDRYLAGVDDATTPRDFAAKIVEEYAASLQGYPLTIGALAIDLPSLGPVADAVDELSVVLSETLTTTSPFIAQAYTTTQKFDSNWDLELAPPDAYVDLYDFARQLSQLVPPTQTGILSATQAVFDALDGVVVSETHQAGQPWLNPSVTWTYSGAHGLSIYLPLGEDIWLRDYYRSTELALAADTRWDEFIHDAWYAGQAPPSLPPAATLGIQDTAASQPIDPATRPGLLSVQRFWSFLPIVFRK